MDFKIGNTGYAYNNANVIPDYIRVKQNILDLWFKIQKEYHDYIQKRSYNLEFSAVRLFSLIKTLHYLNLYPYIQKSVQKEKMRKEKTGEYNQIYNDFCSMMEESKKSSFAFDESQITKILEFLSDYLYELGITKVDFDLKSYDEQFSESYGDQ